MSGVLRTPFSVVESNGTFLEGEVMPFSSSLACVETLESRTLLGGHPIIFGGVQPSNVTAKIVGSDVEIRGDALANTIVITPVGTSGTRIRIAGLSGTTINGNASATLSGVDDINIQMGNGNDNVAVTNLPISGSLVILPGDGADTTTVSGSTIGHFLTVRDHLGADTVTLLKISAKDRTRLSTGGDGDTLNIDDSTFSGTVQIKAGAGDDHVNIERVSSAAGKTTFRQDVSMGFADGNDLLDIGIGKSANVAVFKKKADWDGGLGNDFETRSNATFVSGQPTIRRWEIS
jgi:hypothetical protein